MEISIIEGNEKYNSGVELQSRDLNLVLKKKIAMIVREVPFAVRSFSQKYSPDFEVFWGNHERSVKNYFPGNYFTSMEISIIQRNENIQFWSEATKL